VLDLFQNLALGAFMVCLTVAVHFLGLIALVRTLRRGGHRFHAHESVAGQGLLIVSVVLGIVAIHTLEIWLYAVVFLAIGSLDDFESALYFSTVSFSSLGYGDVLLAMKWRLVGAIEGMNGLILIAWSTAFLFSVTTRLRTLEHDWLERPNDASRQP
jgi:hypothetical protein